MSFTYTEPYSLSNGFGGKGGSLSVLRIGPRSNAIKQLTNTKVVINWNLITGILFNDHLFSFVIMQGIPCFTYEFIDY